MVVVTLVHGPVMTAALGFTGGQVRGMVVAESAQMTLTALGFGALPVCVAKTQYSFSDDAAKRGAPEGFDTNLRMR